MALPECRDTPLDKKGIMLKAEFSNMQDMFIRKSCLGICFGLLLKNKMAAMAVSLMVMKEFYTYQGFFLSMESRSPMLDC